MRKTFIHKPFPVQKSPTLSLHVPYNLSFYIPLTTQITEWLRWQGSLQLIWSNLLLKQGHLSGCPEPCPDSFGASLRMEISPPFWTTCASTPVTLTVRTRFLTFPLHFSLCLLPWSRVATPCCGSIYPLILYMPPAPPVSPLLSLRCSTSCAWALVRS